MKYFFICFFLSLLIIPQSGFSVTKEELIQQQDAFQMVAQEVGPAVVSVTVVQVYTYGGKQYYYPFRNVDPHLNEFLNDFFEQPYQFKQSGLGSGVIIDKAGYILTNEHVVSGASEIEVTLSDGRKFKGIVQGSDPRSDLAVIKIEADNLPVAELGDSDSVNVGEWVVAIGNPFGFAMSNPQPTITVGVVSALHRSFAYTSTDQIRYYGNLIQTDAAINRGNSGGPLVNLNGEVIGVSALIYSTTGGYQGVGFAIPINRAKKILKELIAGNEIRYGWLGVQVQSLTPELVSMFKLQSDKGALIAEVIPKSPAFKYGLHKGDIITKIDTKDITSSSDLVNAVAHMEVGQEANIIISRNNDQTVIKVKIGERPQEEVIYPKKELSTKNSWRGMEVTELTQDMDITQNTGVVVQRIEPGTPAAYSNIHEGDVIDEINRTEIKDIDDFNKMTSKASGDILVHTSKGYFVIKDEE